MKKKVLQVSLATALVWASSPIVAFQLSLPAQETSPGLSMKETEAWIKRELRAMGSDHIVTKYKATTWGDKYEIESAILSGCVLTVRQVTQHEVFLDDGTVMPVRNRQIHASRITMKDVDVGKGLRAMEYSVGPDSTLSKPSYGISIVALSDRGDPFVMETDGYAGGKTNKSVRGVGIRVRDQNLGNQAGEVLRRAAVLCGAPSQPVETALPKTAPEAQVGGAPANTASPKADPVSPGGNAASARVGKYVRKDKSSDSYFELAADGKFHLFQAGKHYYGNYSIQGDVIAVQARNIRGNGEHFVGTTIVEADGTVWVKETVQSETQSTAINQPSQGPSKMMTNDDVIQLVTAGLSEQVVTTSIRQAPARNFDLTPTGLIALKKAGVSDAVILAMQERGAPVQAPVASEAKTPPKYDATLGAPPKPAAAPDGCAGIENMGLYKNEIFDRAMGGGIVEWLAKIRNNSGVTKIVIFGWRDVNGQQQRSQVQIRGGEIASPRLDMSQARVIPPVADVRVLSCQ